MKAGKGNVCEHVGKLSRKSLENLCRIQPISECYTCGDSLVVGQRICVCLHCSALFCANRPECMSAHAEMQHLFWMEIIGQLPSLLQGEQGEKDGQIKCVFCGSLNEQTGEHGESEKMEKVRRFCKYIQENIYIKLKDSVYCALATKIQDEGYPVGLLNLGNTCFLNAVLQILCNTDRLTLLYKKPWRPASRIRQNHKDKKQIEVFYDEVIQKQQSQQWHVVGKTRSKRNEKHSNKQNKPSTTVADFQFNTLFAQFVGEYKNAQELGDETLSPVKILEKIGQFDEKYQHNGEQDAEELMMLIIDVLAQGELLNISSKQRYIEVQKIIGQQKLTEIQGIFGSYLASRVKCLSCFKQSWALDLTYSFSVPLTSSFSVPLTETKTEVDQAIRSELPIPGILYYKELFYPQLPASSTILDSLFRSQRLTLHNYYKCEGCNGTTATKQFFIVEPAPILIISFKRFDHQRPKQKITRHVKFEQYLQIGSLVLHEQQQQRKELKYRLYGVIVHEGNTVSSGHYTCCIRIGRHWYSCSDHRIRKIQYQQVQQKQAYILLYEQFHE